MMPGGAGTAKRNDATAPLDAGAQENIAAAGKYFRPGAKPSRRTRDWQLYFFFRILTRAEMRATVLAARRSTPVRRATARPAPDVTESYASNPYPFDTAELKRSGEPLGIGEAGKAAEEFRAWLAHVTGHKTGSANTRRLIEQLAGVVAAGEASDAGADSKREAQYVAHAGARAVERGLMTVVQYEILRHHLLAQSGGRGGAIRPEAEAVGLSSVPSERVEFDPASINLAFTWNGLKQLGLSDVVLQSFPDPFRDGMAARARRLHDTGPNAPENWYGELGSSRIHGYFTGGFVADGAREPAWKALRRDVHLFNLRHPDAKNVRQALRQLFARLGMELMHIELGQAPYSVGADGSVESILPRIEHFGFRDGVSQPFVDMRLDADGRMAAPAPGGATPGRNRTWTPLSSGEIYLGYPDEDGNCIEQPANELLRHAGTYIVFRKLAQDVSGFRNFLKSQRPNSREAQDLLAAQIVGRWKSGAPLVRHPRHDGGGDDASLNDFRYGESDPYGDKCPLGSHVRRSNPRDIGGRNNVRRHRIMRRSMAYGGPYIPEDAADTGDERGLLFVCANARIDMQFEVVQGDWLNRGEFLGQAGLGRCPLTGSNDRAGDTFLECGRGVPVTAVPQFVTMRGGDYFFAPSLEALKGLAEEGETFEPDLANLEACGHAFGDVRTEGLFSEERLARLARKVLAGNKTPVRYRLPPAAYGQASFGSAQPVEPPDIAGDVVFVRSHADVSFVLASTPEPSTGKVAFTAAHSRVAGHRMLGRGNLLVGTDWAPTPPCERQILSDILETAWDRDANRWREQLRLIVRRSLCDAIARTAPSGHIDLVRDLAADTIFAVVTRLFGVAAPDHLTELAMATPFGRRHVGQVHPEWLISHARSADENPGLVTLKMWSFLVGLNLVGDFQAQRPLIALGQQAASEALLHIDSLIGRERERRPNTPPTLLSAFVAIEQAIIRQHAISIDAYYDHVRSLVFELALTATAVVPAVFGKFVDASFRFGLDLEQLVPALDAAARSGKASPDAGIEALIYEVNRLDPALPLVLRRCEADGGVQLPSGGFVQNGQWIAALVAGANLDADAFPGPDQFSLGAFVPGSLPRERSNYLMFGVQGGGSGRTGTRTCWGRDRIALYTLVECARAAATLPGLRSVPGPEGRLKKLLGIASGLNGRFAPFSTP